MWTAGHDGVIPGIGGVEPQWENQATAFALLSDDSGPHFPAITRPVVRVPGQRPVSPYRGNGGRGVQAGAPLDQDSSGLNSKVTCAHTGPMAPTCCSATR